MTEKFETCLLITEGPSAHAPANYHDKISIIAYLKANGIYQLLYNNGSIQEVFVTQEQLILIKPQGKTFISYNPHKPVIIWCENPVGQTNRLKVYSLAQSDQQTSQPSLLVDPKIS